MTVDEGLRPARERARQQWPLWFGLLGSPLAWGIHLGLSYWLVPRACAFGEVWLHLATVVSLLLGGVAVWAAQRTWSSGRGAHAGEATGACNRFLGATGMIIAILFIGAILMQGLQPLLLDACA